MSVTIRRWASIFWATAAIVSLNAGLFENASAAVCEGTYLGEGIFQVASEELVVKIANGRQISGFYDRPSLLREIIDKKEFPYLNEFLINCGKLDASGKLDHDLERYGLVLGIEEVLPHELTHRYYFEISALKSFYDSVWSVLPDANKRAYYNALVNSGSYSSDVLLKGGTINAPQGTLIRELTAYTIEYSMFNLSQTRNFFSGTPTVTNTTDLIEFRTTNGLISYDKKTYNFTLTLFNSNKQATNKVLVEFNDLVNFRNGSTLPVDTPAQTTTGNANQSTNLPSNTNTAQGGTGSLPQYNRGVDTSIRDFLCTPTEDGNDLPRCINRIYKFGVTVGAIALVFFVVWAGYMYMVGGETAKSKAKGMISNSMLGIGLLLGSYVLLRFINPSLVAFRPIQPPIFDAKLPNCADVGLGPDCVVATGSGYSSSTGSGDIVAVATAELGKKGAFNNPDATLATSFGSRIISIASASNSGPEIDKYFSPGGTPGQPWCAYFASWVYGAAGIKTIGTLPGRGGTMTLHNYFKNNDGKKIAEGTIKYMSSADINSGAATPLPGDLAFYDRGSEGDSNGHTAIVTGYDPTQKKMSSIDGNLGQTDEVKKAVRDINKQCSGNSTCKLIGVGRVIR